jgi:hypothetical protein
MSTQGQGDVVERLDEWIQTTGALNPDDYHTSIRVQDVVSARDEIAHLRTLLSSSRGEQGWRTMDSAPKDGTHIIGNTQWGAREIWWHKDAYEGEYWTDEGDSEPAPTGWIPKPGSVPTSLAGQVPDIIPMGRENDGDKHVTAYMCLVDFECEIGLASGGNIVYPSIEECREGRKCVGGCGIVEVEIRATRVVQEPSDDGEVALAGAEIEAQSSPQPTAGGDAPAIARGSFSDEPECCPRCGKEWEEPDPYALANGIDRSIKLAVSAERARVIELESALKGAIANLEHVSVFDEADDDDQEAIEARSAWQRDLDRFRAALRALGQQDTADIAAAKEALADFDKNGGVTLDELKSELGQQDTGGADGA